MNRAHIKELDSLRAIAVGLVFIQHWNVAGLGHFYTGGWGVRFFFVLSGFLITGIWLNSRERIVKGSSLSEELKTFYIRRTLRIFPVYYLVLTLVAFLSLPGFYQNLPWHVLYGSNIRYSLDGHWPQTASHLWSLAVEEQFYLLWPAMIFLLPRRVVLPAIVALIAFAPIFRHVIRLSSGHHIAAMTLMPGCLDSLGIGALLAYARHQKMDTSAWSLPLLATGLPILAIDLEFGLALIGAGVVNVVTNASGSRLMSFLRIGPIGYLGTISYGLYLYHPFIYQLLLPYDLPGKLVIYTVATIGIAALSWEGFEKPILRLKGRFAYNAPSAVTVQ